MKMDTDDRRVRKTKKALREGLAELMLEKELRSITVRELCDKVDIHRATFYAHYADIYALYKQLEDTVVNEVGAIIVGDPTHTYEGVFKSLIDYIYSNTQICYMLLNKNGNCSFRNWISGFLEEKYFDIWQYETGENEVTEEWWFLARYHIQGCLAIISRWAESGYAYPKDKLCDIILKIDTHFDKIMSSK